MAKSDDNTLDPDCETRWRECPYQRFFDKYCRQLREKQTAYEDEDDEIEEIRVIRPSVSHSRSRSSLTPESFTPRCSNSSTTPATPPLRMDDRTCSSRRNSKSQNHKDIDTCLRRTSEPNRISSRPDSICSINSSTEHLEMGAFVEEPEDIAVELDDRHRPRLKLLTSFLGGF